MYGLDDLRTCKDDCLRCPHSVSGQQWSAFVGEVCTGECIGSYVCPWLMVCRCLNPHLTGQVASRLAQIASSQPQSHFPALVPVKYVQVWENGIRRYRSAEDIAILQEAIARSGLVSYPIGVALRDTAKILVFAGITRLEAIIGLGWKNIPVRVLHLQAVNDIQLLIGALQENVVRREITWEEQCRAVHRIWEGLGKPSVRALAQHLGKPRTWVARRLEAARNLEVGEPAELREAQTGPEETGAVRWVSPSHRSVSRGFAAAVQQTFRLRFQPQDLDRMLNALGIEDGRDVRLIAALVRARDGGGRASLRLEDIRRLLDVLGVAVPPEDDDPGMLRQLLREALNGNRNPGRDAG